MKTTTILVLLAICLAFVAAKWVWIEEAGQDFLEDEEGATTLQSTKKCVRQPGSYTGGKFPRCNCPTDWKQTTGFCQCERCNDNFKVVFFEHCNYVGKSWGVLAFEEQANVGDSWNDQFSSVRVFPGTKLTVYEHDNFQGASKTFTEDVACLDDWNDRITSFKVEPL